MGWLQGIRYRNALSLSQVSNELPGKSASVHIENLPSQTTRDVTVPTENNVNLAKQDMTKSPLNEIEALLEATFGHRGSEKGHKGAQSCIQLPADPSSAGLPRTHRVVQDTEVDDDKLPVIPTEEVISKKLAVGVDGLIDETSSDCLWIVVDNVVYDCSEFIEDHPGGKQVILSFVGEDCSWQFWRFHSRSQMEQYGRPLRIGRTEAVSNRFDQRPKYVGLRRNRDDEW